MKPTQWEVPTFVEITHAPAECASLLGIYYHTPQFFNIDVYKKRDEHVYMYYFYRNDSACGWLITGKDAISAGGCANPCSRNLGTGSHRPAGMGRSCMGKLQWRGDGRHYTVKGDSPAWNMCFHFEADENCRSQVIWEAWEETKDSLRPKALTLPASRAAIPDIERGLDYLLWSTNFQHIENVEVVSLTALKYECTCLRDARIPSGSPSPCPCKAADATKRLQITMLSGTVAMLEVPAPHQVAVVKDMIAQECRIPTNQQRLLIEGEDTELSDEDMVHVDSLLLICQDPPMIETAEFLESLVHCLPEFDHDGTGSIVKTWHRFDTYQIFPETREDLSAWALQKSRQAISVPLTTTNVLACFESWLNLQEETGEHPEAFCKNMQQLEAFFAEYCFSPSLVQAHEEPYGHNDDLEFLMFFVGRLRIDPQAILVATIYLNCYC